jgi:hypothetical protein
LAGGVNNQIQYNNSGVLNGFTMSGDATIVPTTGAITVSKTGGVAFAASATTNTTLTGNINYTQGGTGSVSRTVTSKLQESVSVLDFGADPTGATDSTTAIDSACSYINSVGGGTVLFPPGTYIVKRAQVGNQRGIYIRGNVHLIGYGATLDMQANASFFNVQPTTTETITISADVAVGDTSFTVASAGTLAAGDKVFVRLNTSSYDPYEPATWYWATVSTVAGTTVTIDHPSQTAMIAASTSAINRALVKVSNVSDVFVEGLNFTCSVPAITGQVEACVNAFYVHGLTVKNCTASNCGSGLVVAQYCETVWMDSCSADGIRAEVASKGRFASFAECDGVLGTNLIIRNFAATVAAVIVEAGCQTVAFKNVIVDVDGSTGTGGQRYFISALGQGPIVIDGLTLLNKNVYPITGSTLLGVSVIKNLNVQCTYTVDGMSSSVAEIESMVLNGVQYERRVITARVAIPVNGNKSVQFPSGLQGRIQILATSITGLTNVFARRDSSFTNNGSNLTPASANLSSLTSTNYITLNSNSRNYNDNKQLYVEASASMGAGNYVYAQIETLIRETINETSGTSMLTYIDA